MRDGQKGFGQTDNKTISTRPPKAGVKSVIIVIFFRVLYGNIDQTLVNSLHVLLNTEIGGFNCRAITTEYISCVH